MTLSWRKIPACVSWMATSGRNTPAGDVMLKAFFSSRLSARRPAPGWVVRLGGRSAAGLAVVVTLAAAAPSPAHPVSRASTASSPSAAFSGGAFKGVSSASAADAWAVGEISGTNRTILTLVARWDGSGWTQVPSPSPGGANAGSFLTGVSAVSASDAWAVGYYGTFGLSTLVLRWDGSGWTQVPSPNPGYPASSSTLYGVSAVSASDAWAVGTYGNVEQTLVLAWNGTSWTQVPAPSPGGAQGSQLLGVTSTSKSDAWAVGCYGSNQPNIGQQTLALHWNGASWTQAPTPSPGASGCLTAVTAVSPSSAWAVGWTAASLTGSHQTLVLHWNGARWTQMASPAPLMASSELNGVSAISATDAWAVGDVVRNLAATTLVLHWNGARWVTTPSPSQGSSVLSGVSDVSARDALAVGSGSSGTLALRWNGSRWVAS
jgi:hypothetical protein